MTVDEVRRVLKKASSYDSRKVDDPTVNNWHDMLAGITYGEAIAAIDNYYSSTREWMMPSDLLRLVRHARTEREEADIRKNSRGLPWDHCGNADCPCTHTHCSKGILDRLVPYQTGPDHPFPGKIYMKAQRCPVCHPGASQSVAPIVEVADAEPERCRTCGSIRPIHDAKVAAGVASGVVDHEWVAR